MLPADGHTDIGVVVMETGWRTVRESVMVESQP